MGSFALWLTGEPDRALALSKHAQQVAEQAYDPFEHEHTAMLAEGALLHAWRREPVRASELAKRALDCWTVEEVRALEPEYKD